MGSKTCSAPLAYTPADESASGAVVLMSTSLKLPLLPFPPAPLWLQVEPASGAVALTIELTTPACPVKEVFKNQANDFVKVGGRES